MSEPAELVRRGRATLDDEGWWWGYCLNAHPTETLEELHAALDLAAAVRAHTLRDQDAADARLGVELRLGAEGIEALDADPAAVDALGAALIERKLVAFSANGFPLSVFTRGQVKTDVYRPDWTDPERGRLTLALARALVRLAPISLPAITISTVAGGFAGDAATDAATEQAMFAQLRATADALQDLEQETGRRVVLCLEPEPFTTLESTPETVSFFLRLLDGPAADVDRWRHHLALNLDICHQAVVFESLQASLHTLTGAAVPIAKVHVSAALRLPRPTAADLAALARYDEPRYLHQTFVRRRGADVWAPERHLDLGPFLASNPDPAEIDELRVHFHVPLHAEPEGRLESTAADVLEALDWLIVGDGCRVAALETYTWDVLAARGLTGDEQVVQGLAEELRWFAARMGERQPRDDTRRIRRLTAADLNLNLEGPNLEGPNIEGPSI